MDSAVTLADDYVLTNKRSFHKPIPHLNNALRVGNIPPVIIRNYTYTIPSDYVNSTSDSSPIP